MAASDSAHRDAVPSRSEELLQNGSAIEVVPSQRQGSSRRHAFVINIIEYASFTELLRRKGAEFDTAAILSLWGFFEYTVEVYPHSTVNADQFLQAIVRFMNRMKAMSKSLDSIFVFIMGHGQKQGIISSDGALMDYKKIASFFDNRNCPDLMHVQKVFFFQSCRGFDFDTGAEKIISLGLATDGHHKNGYISTPFENVSYQDRTNTLIIYATVPGYASVREDHGTWFIQSVCRIFRECAAFTNLEDLVKLVQEDVKRKSYDGEDCVYKQSVESVNFYFLKKFYFKLPNTVQNDPSRTSAEISMQVPEQNHVNKPNNRLKRRVALILNIRPFINNYPPNATLACNTDSTMLKTLWKHMGFSVTYKEDLDYPTFLKVLRDFAIQVNSTHIDCAVIFIMGLANARGFKLPNSSKTFLFAKILELFDNSHCFISMGTPKMFFFQTYEFEPPEDISSGQTGNGILQSNGTPLSSDGLFNRSGRMFITLPHDTEVVPSHTDILITYSTVSVEYAQDNENFQSGSPFVRALCDILPRECGNTHLEDCLKMVQGICKQTADSAKITHPIKIISRAFTQHVYLHPCTPWDTWRCRLFPCCHN